MEDENEEREEEMEKEEEEILRIQKKELEEKIKKEKQIEKEIEREKKRQEKDYTKTYGIFHFKRPSPIEIEQALGLSGEPALFKRLISSGYEQFYDFIKAPEEGDWLMEHKEFGQTYEEFKRKDCRPINPSQNVIYIKILEFSPKKDKNKRTENYEILDEDFIEGLKKLCLTFFLGMNVQLSKITKEFDAGKEECSIQLNASELLNSIIEEKPKDAYCLLCLTNADLFFEKRLPNGDTHISPVCGARNIAVGCSVFSFARFYPLFGMNKEGFSDDKKMKLYYIMVKRISNAITREICYLFGMKNCIYFNCGMNGTSKNEFDSKPIELCPVCLRKLITLISAKGKDLKNYRIKNPKVVYNRYVKLKKVLDENFFGIYDDEVYWLEKRIEYLDNLI